MTPIPHTEVLSAFAQLTGIKFRILPDTVMRQAVIFGETFTLVELELVIQFIDRELKAGRCGYNQQSKQWKTLMGDFGATNAFQNFQERLGLAEKACEKGWRPRLTLGAQPAQPKPRQASSPLDLRVSVEEQKRLADQAREITRQFRF